MEAAVLPTGGRGSKSISVAVPLGRVLSSEVGGGGSSRRHVSVQSAVLRGEAGAGQGADVPGASHCRADCWFSFSNQRAVGAKGLWGVNHVSTLYLLHFASGVYFKQLSGSCLCLASRIPHCPAAPERVAVLELVCHQPHGKCSCQFWLPDHLRMLCGAG